MFILFFAYLIISFNGIHDIQYLSVISDLIFFKTEVQVIERWRDAITIYHSLVELRVNLLNHLVGSVLYDVGQSVY